MLADWQQLVAADLASAPGALRHARARRRAWRRCSAHGGAAPAGRTSGRRCCARAARRSSPPGCAATCRWICWTARCRRSRPASRQPMAAPRRGRLSQQTCSTPLQVLLQGPRRGEPGVPRTLSHAPRCRRTAARALKPGAARRRRGRGRARVQAAERRGAVRGWRVAGCVPAGRRPQRAAASAPGGPVWRASADGLRATPSSACCALNPL
jgi:hypothetical protein